MRGSHNKLGEGGREVRLGQDSLPNTEFLWQKLAETNAVVLPAPPMDRFKLTGQNLGQFFNSRCVRACVCHAMHT